MTDPTTPGPECGKASRPIERRGLKGQCDGCYGWHWVYPGPFGWAIPRHEPSDADGHQCPGEGCSTRYEPPVYCRLAPPLCGDCIAKTPDGHDERGRPYWISEDGTPEYREQGVEA